MTDTTQRRRQTLQHEKSLMGIPWESERSRKRRLRAARAAADKRGYNGNAGALLASAAAFAAHDDAVRAGRRFARIDPARGDGKKPTQRERQEVVVTYNESARRILGY